ncbi:MAG: bifunctional riboflavin kinase/FAD synthetase [Verrucomicrobia bacterium]|nr:bifunctional riboflavin kinase/FAD synthetase [Verrucomicrobiota bacterium]
MRVFGQPSELDAGGREVCAAIGMFDGVHRGHQAVLQAARDLARSGDGLAVVVTFDPHPRRVLTPEQSPALLQSIPQKLSVLESLGMDAVWLISFDLAFSRIEGLDFLNIMKSGFGRLRAVFLGSDFHFGHKRSGNATVLERWGAREGVEACAVASVSCAGGTVSSTRVREAVSGGQLDGAAAMLGRPFELAGWVRRGDQVGRKLGFPTANLEIEGRVHPPRGVYAARCRHEGRWLGAAVNIGLRPTLTVPTPHLQIEAHLLDWEGDCYEKELRLEFLKRIRDEQRFESTEELRRQIASDIEAVRRLV